jgi:hypothetical protein
MKYLFIILSFVVSSAYGDAFSNPPPSQGVSQGTVPEVIGSDGYAHPNSATYPLYVSGGGSGSSSVTQGTSPWADNITQFGGNPIVTGIGASGAGIPRFSLSSDSLVGLTGTLPAFAVTPTFLATQSVGSNLHAVIDSGSIVSAPLLGSTMNTTPATVTTTAAQILPAATNPVLRQIYNNSTTLTIYIGGTSGITGPTNAFPIPPLNSYDASKFSSAVYAISPGGSVTASLIQY